MVGDGRGKGNGQGRNSFGLSGYSDSSRAYDIDGVQELYERAYSTTMGWFGEITVIWKMVHRGLKYQI